MANNINRLNFNIAGYNYSRQDEVAANSTPEKKAEVETKGNQNTMGANEILGFMAAANADMIPVKVQKTVDVNKYVTKEQEERISSFIKGLEADYDEAKSVALNEFGISEETAGKIAVAYINASY